MSSGYVGSFIAVHFYQLEASLNLKTDQNNPLLFSMNTHRFAGSIWTNKFNFQTFLIDGQSNKVAH